MNKKRHNPFGDSDTADRQAKRITYDASDPDLGQTKDQQTAPKHSMTSALNKLECAVCLERMTKVATTSCGHLFCEPCIRESLKTNARCPICRKPLPPEDDPVTPVVFTTRNQKAGKQNATGTDTGGGSK